MDNQQPQDWQMSFLDKAERLEQEAETAPNPEWNNEWADTLRTLSRVDNNLQEERQPAAEERPTSTFMLGTRFSEMEQMELEPIWPGWIYSGIITGVIGEEGTGKSTLMTALAARVSSGRNAPDGGRTRMGTVLYIGPEEFDDLTVLSRLRTEEANLENVISLRRILDTSFKLPTHLELLKAAIIHYKASLVVIDPLTPVIARGATINSIAGAYDFLDPLQNMLHETECGLVFITHFTKMSKNAKTSDRAFGSKGIYAFLRIYCTLSVDQATGKVLLHQDKNNLGIPKAPDLYIERLTSGKLFFSGAGSTPDFRTVSELQRLSMGRQAILSILDSDPLRDFPAGLVHQCMLQLYPHMGSSTTRSLLHRMSTPDKDGKTAIGKTAWGYYYSHKRSDLLAEMEKQQAEQETQEDNPSTPATSATSATVQDDSSALIVPTHTVEAVVP